jgi:hypothetical protein
MASKFKVLVNPYEQNSDTTADAIIVAVKNQDSNARPEIVRDYQGKVIEVRLDNVLPEKAEQARAAVAGNKGVATVGIAIPQHLAITNLDDAAGIAYSDTEIDDQAFEISSLNQVSFGSYRNNAYADGANVTAPDSLVLLVYNGNVLPFSVAAGSVSIKYNGLTARLTLANSAPVIVAGAASVYAPNINVYYIDVAGKLYNTGFALVNGQPVGTILTFDQAVANGAV